MDVVAATDDQVLLAADDSDVSVLIHLAEIAGHEPARAVEGSFGAGLVVEIAHPQTGALPAKFARFAGRNFAIGIFGVPELEREAVTGPTARVDDDVRGIARSRILERAVLSHSKTVLRRYSEPQQGSH